MSMVASLDQYTDVNFYHKLVFRELINKRPVPLSMLTGFLPFKFQYNAGRDIYTLIDIKKRTAVLSLLPSGKALLRYPRYFKGTEVVRAVFGDNFIAIQQAGLRRITSIALQAPNSTYLLPDGYRAVYGNIFTDPEGLFVMKNRYFEHNGYKIPYIINQCAHNDLYQAWMYLESAKVDIQTPIMRELFETAHVKFTLDVENKHWSAADPTGEIDYSAIKQPRSDSIAAVRTFLTDVSGVIKLYNEQRAKNERRKKNAITRAANKVLKVGSKKRGAVSVPPAPLPSRGASRFTEEYASEYMLPTGSGASAAIQQSRQGTPVTIPNIRNLTQQISDANNAYQAYNAAHNAPVHGENQAIEQAIWVDEARPLESWHPAPIVDLNNYSVGSVTRVCQCGSSMTVMHSVTSIDTTYVCPSCGRTETISPQF